MTLVDLNDGYKYTLKALYDEWKVLNMEEPYNHSNSFKIEMFEILMATIYGRNDCRIEGLTPKETSRIINRIRNSI